MSRALPIPDELRAMVESVAQGRTGRSRAHALAANLDHYLYRCYDADDVLLYIGCTANVDQRIQGHLQPGVSAKASKWLAVCMERHETEGPFRGRLAGRAAESAAIKAERPLFNTYEQGLGATMWPRRARVGKYLVAKGHRGLAVETTCNCERINDMNIVTCPAHGRSGGAALRLADA
jgi:hypothetical protein